MRATAHQLDFSYGRGPEPGSPRPPRQGPAPLCVVCGRVPAHLILDRHDGHQPVKLCLRCHHAVMQQRRMLRASLSAGDDDTDGHGAPSRPYRFLGDAGLIVTRESELSPAAKAARLSRSRRRAQTAARRALGQD